MSARLHSEKGAALSHRGGRREQEPRAPRSATDRAPAPRKPTGLVTYFAYGSNLDVLQMHARCAGARLAARAVLPDYALAFGGFSRRWNGPVASVIRRPGKHVEGLLYRLPRPDLRALDRFEGCPTRYRRVRRFVVDENGRQRKAQVYLQPVDGFAFGAPPSEYFDILWHAYSRLGFDPWPLALAARRRP